MDSLIIYKGLTFMLHYTNFMKFNHFYSYYIIRILTDMYLLVRILLPYFLSLFLIAYRICAYL